MIDKPFISLVINAKNEESDIVECIRSARELVSEVVVADMHSTDRTAEFAKNEGATVFAVKDVGYVEPARNEAIQKAKGEWVLLLDADERLSPGLVPVLSDIAQNDKADIVEIVFKTIILGKWMQHTKWWPIHLKRFFKKIYVKWPTKIHGTPEYRGRVLRLDAREDLSIVHYNFSSVEEIATKFIQYAKHERRVSKTDLSDPELFFRFIESGFYERFFLFEGLKDGLHGFFMSKFIEFYRLMELAYEWERKGYKNAVSAEAISDIIRKERNTLVEWENTVLKKENLSLKEMLRKIESAKFYQFWQWYCDIRDRLLLKKR